ncbi:MAG: class F sortase [Chloroflexi bacterium]|nr:class F sortase [Chloroflexota bacterium]MDA1147250.1 class F sortase [Chloroflexota bacterium]
MEERIEQLRRLLQQTVRGASIWWKAQTVMVRRGLLGALGALGLMVVLGALVASSADGAPGVVARLRSGATPGGTPGGSATGSPTASETPTPEPPIGSISELVSEFGDPPGYNFARLRIPLLAVDAPVGISIVDGSAGAQLGIPEGPATVFWYDMSAWQDLGGRPGEGRNAIFGAHADISGYLPYADVNYHGPAVFRDLALLQPGDQIFIDYNGESLQYVVQWSDQVEPGNLSRWSEIWSDSVETDSITLYTCGGDFDYDSREYADRVVVRAARS